MQIFLGKLTGLRDLLFIDNKEQNESKIIQIQLSCGTIYQKWGKKRGSQETTEFIMTKKYSRGTFHCGEKAE